MFYVLTTLCCVSLALNHVRSHCRISPRKNAPEHCPAFVLELLNVAGKDAQCQADVAASAAAQVDVKVSDTLGGHVDGP